MDQVIKSGLDKRYIMHQAERDVGIIVWRFIKAYKTLGELRDVQELLKKRNLKAIKIALLIFFLYMPVAWLFPELAISGSGLAVIGLGVFWVALMSHQEKWDIADQIEIQTYREQVALAEWEGYFPGDAAFLYGLANKFPDPVGYLRLTDVTFWEEFPRVRQMLNGWWVELNYDDAE